MTRTVTAPTQAKQPEIVRHWRHAELLRAGYSPADAVVLSGRPDVDLHVAVKLIRDGCSVETALRILL